MIQSGSVTRVPLQPDSISKRSAHPELIVVGHITCDRLPGHLRLGGAASFAALAAAALGVKTGVITSAAIDFELLDELVTSPLLEVFLVDSRITTCFELDYSGPVRKVRLIARANDIRVDAVPPHLLSAKAIYLAPVINECGVDLLDRFHADVIVAGAQGWLRIADAQGNIVPHVSPQFDAISSRMTALVWSELDHPESDRLAKEVSAKVPYVIVTRGARGLTLYTRQGTQDFSSDPAQEAEPTGAGDVFASVLTVALSRNLAIDEAILLAKRAAARVVEGPGLGTLVSAIASGTIRLPLRSSG